MPKSLRLIAVFVQTKGIRNLFGLLLLLLCAQSTFGQGAFVSGSAQGTVNGALRSLPGATVTVCAANTTGIPCSPALSNTLFKDQALTQPLANPTTTDSNGNYNFAVAAGTYTLTITATGFTGSTQQITVTCGTGGCTATSLTVTGATTLNSLTVNGTGTIGSLNGELHVTNAGPYTTIAQAVTAAGSVNPTMIWIEAPPAYTGTDVPALQANITYMDLRGGSGCSGGICSPGINNAVTWNGNDNAVHSLSRFIMQRGSPTTSETAVYGQCQFSGALPASQSLQCVTGEVDLNGAITSVGAGLSVSAAEHSVIINSTGGTIPNIYTLLANGNTLGGSTTNVTNWYGLRTQVIGKSGTGTITNAIGAVFDNQTVGATNNWAFEVQGEGRFDCSQAAQQCFHIVANTSANRNTMRVSNTAASGGDWLMGDGSCSAGTVGQWEMCNLNVGASAFTAIKNTGTNFALLAFAPTAGRTYTFPDASGTVLLLGSTGVAGIQTQRFGASCTTAASAQATCTSTFSWPTPFTNTSYTPVCWGEGPSGSPILTLSTTQIAASITVQVQNAAASASSFAGVYCNATHD